MPTTSRDTLRLRILAILNIAFGFLLGSCSMWEGVFFVQPGILGETPMKPEFLQFLETEVPGYAAVTGGYLLAKTVLSALLIVAGIGLLIRKPWGRWMSAGYAVATLLSQAAICVFQIAFVNPATVRYFQQPQFLTTHHVESVIYAVAGAAYAAVLLVCVNLTSVKSQLKRDAPA